MDTIVHAKKCTRHSCSLPNVYTAAALILLTIYNVSEILMGKAAVPKGGGKDCTHVAGRFSSLGVFSSLLTAHHLVENKKAPRYDSL